MTNAQEQPSKPIILDEHCIGGAADAPLNAYSLHKFGLKGVQLVEGMPELELILDFQSGPPAQVGRNGFTNEEVIVAVLHRLREFNKTDFSCRENSLAITKLEEALHWLQARTLARLKREVEGTLIK